MAVHDEINSKNQVVLVLLKCVYYIILTQFMCPSYQNWHTCLDIWPLYEEPLIIYAAQLVVLLL